MAERGLLILAVLIFGPPLLVVVAVAAEEFATALGPALCVLAALLLLYGVWRWLIRLR